MRRSAALLAALALCLPVLSARADDVDGKDGPKLRQRRPPRTRVAPIFEDPVLQRMWDLDRIAPFEDKAPLWSYADRGLEAEVLGALRELKLLDAVRRKKLAVVLVEISDVERPRVANINGDVMLYAASLPKIAILLGAFEKIAEGKLRLDAETERQLEDMIRVSSNTAATAMARKVGKRYIARTMLSPRYRLYDPEHNGGLWVGKDYAKKGLWKRDPLHNLSHGATAMQVARYYYLLQTGNLVTPAYSRKMKQILSKPAIQHKFVSGLNMVNPAALLFRKSGSWRTFHSDSVLVERDGRAYIAVALADSPDAKRWLGPIIVSLDSIVFGKSWLHGLAGVN